MNLRINKTFFNRIILLFIIFTIAFIFSNSLRDVAASRAQSDRVLDIVEPVLTPIVGKGKVTSQLVRKLAHFVEFAVLGVELGLLQRRFCTGNFLTAIMVALMDETIQIFSSRGSQVQDVWLDFSGACVGMFVGVGMWYVWKGINKG